MSVKVKCEVSIDLGQDWIIGLARLVLAWTLVLHSQEWLGYWWAIGGDTPAWCLPTLRCTAKSDCVLLGRGLVH